METFTPVERHTMVCWTAKITWRNNGVQPIGDRYGNFIQSQREFAGKPVWNTLRPRLGPPNLVTYTMTSEENGDLVDEIIAQMVVPTTVIDFNIASMKMIFSSMIWHT